MAVENRIKALIRPQSKVADHEVAELDLFNADGSPLVLGGSTDSGTAAYVGNGNHVGIAEGGPVQIPLDETNHQWLEGLDVDANGRIVLPAGVYLMKLAPDWNWTGDVAPTDGFAGVSLYATYDLNGVPTENWLLSYNMNSNFASTGFGDAGFTNEGVGRKVDVVVVPVEALVELRAEQSLTPGQVPPINVGVAIVKL